MAQKNLLTTSPPYPVEQTVRRLGANLRTARLRRNLTIAEVAEKIGTGPRPVADAEKGKLGTGVAVYMALLWAYDLLESAGDLADPLTDEEGLMLELSQGRTRARKKDELDNDF